MSSCFSWQGSAHSGLQAQNQGGVSEKPFVSGGKIDMQLSGGGYEIRPAVDNKIRVTLEGTPALPASGSRSAAHTPTWW